MIFVCFDRSKTINFMFFYDFLKKKAFKQIFNRKFFLANSPKKKLGVISFQNFFIFY